MATLVDVEQEARRYYECWIAASITEADKTVDVSREGVVTQLHELRTYTYPPWDKLDPTARQAMVDGMGRYLEVDTQEPDAEELIVCDGCQCVYTEGEWNAAGGCDNCMDGDGQVYADTGRRIHGKHE